MGINVFCFYHGRRFINLGWDIDTRAISIPEVISKGGMMAYCVELPVYPAHARARELQAVGGAARRRAHSSL